ncbi:MAG: phenylalanine--tRNA ligase subunit beta [Thermodesulfobacteriota bacterium]|nr:phenylalanine--tRNA ligase subunit beta [Thermodesulfobacteriota bacterium]
MNISYRWIKEFVDIDMDANALADCLTMSGTEVEGVVHQTIPEEVVCARILEVTPHPEADRLHVCTVDNGSEHLQVICGAPNVRKGLMVALAPQGCILGEGMKIKKSKIRGVESFGMLVSEKELGLTDDHEGIIEIDQIDEKAMDRVRPGDCFLRALDLEDWVLDVNVTPNRGDCLSVLGLARELSAIFNQDLHLPAFDLVEDECTIDNKIQVSVLDTHACPRYAARFLDNVRIAKSPFFMRRRLFSSGIRAINTVVDITNYVLMEYGQPMHAFDYNRLNDHSIVVRRAGHGERFLTLDSQERTMDKDDLFICDGKGPVAIAGIMGGESSEVVPETNSVVLESAFFDPITIRRTAKRLNLSTEASYRFERGVDPEIQTEALRRAAYLMGEFAHARIWSGEIDVNHLDYTQKDIMLEPSYLRRILGTNIPLDDVGDVFTRLGAVVERQDKGWAISPPMFRHDLVRPVDLVEEYARIYGMDRIEPRLPAFVPVEMKHEKTAVEQMRLCLASMGFTEVITYSFIAGQWEKWFDTKMLGLKNPISDELSHMRTSLIPGISGVIEKNKKKQIRDVYVFETGKCFFPVDGRDLPEEVERLAIAISGARRDTHWSDPSSKVDFYDIKGIALAVVGPAVFRSSSHAFLRPGEQADIYVEDQKAGVIGCLHPDILDAIDMDDAIYVLEIDTRFAFAEKFKGMEPIPRFPGTARDLSLVVDEKITYEGIEQAVTECRIKEIQAIMPVDLYHGDRLPDGLKGLTIRISYRSDTKTLSDKQVAKWQKKVVRSLEDRLGIRIRD